MQNYNSKEELETIIKQEIDFEKLNELCEHITNAITEILTSCGLYFRIFSRVKSVESIAAKLFRGKYGTLNNPKKFRTLSACALYFIITMTSAYAVTSWKEPSR